MLKKIIFSNSDSLRFIERMEKNVDHTRAPVYFLHPPQVKADDWFFSDEKLKNYALEMMERNTDPTRPFQFSHRAAFPGKEK